MAEVPTVGSPSGRATDREPLVQVDVEVVTAAPAPAPAGAQRKTSAVADSSGDEGDAPELPPQTSRVFSTDSFAWNKIEPVTFSWKNLRFEVPLKNGETKVILDDITGCVPPGQMLAIMGPSGSGKTTLLRTLAGTMTQGTGDVFYNGRRKPREQKVGDILGFRGNAVYIPQDDLLMGSLTVRETLYYAARLKCHLPHADLDTVVEQLIDYLGLQRCADTKIGSVFYKGISGGEKRRVSIGVELVTQPALLFLDEITSGLDSTSAYALMDLCHSLCKRGHTVVMSLHQPSSRIYSKLVQWGTWFLILERGRCMYCGPSSESEQFFADCGFPVPPNTNPTDHYMDVINSDFNQSSSNSDTVHAAMKERRLPALTALVDELRAQGQGYPTVALTPNHVGIQLMALLSREGVNSVRDPTMYLVRLAMYIGMSWALGTAYWQIGDEEEHIQDRVSVLFFCAGFLTFMSVAGLPAFIQQRGVFMKERMNGHYSPHAYAVANFFASLPWLFLMALCASALVYGMVQSRLGGDVFALFLVTLFMALVVAESLMVAISAVSPEFIVGLAVASGTMGLYMLFCGFFLLPRHIPDAWEWVHKGLSFYTYVLQNFILNEFEGLETAGGIHGDDVLDLYDLHGADAGLNIVYLCVMTLAYRVVFYLCLVFFNKVTK